MKIITNFNDYYDDMLSFGRDEGLTFNRINYSNIKPTKPVLDINEIKKVHIKTHEGVLKNFFLGVGENKIKTLLFNNMYGFWKNPEEISDNDKRIIIIHSIINGNIFTSYCLTKYNRGVDFFIKKNITEDEVISFIKTEEIKYKYSVFKRFKTKEQLLECIKKKQIYKNEDETKSGDKILLDLHKELSNPVFFILKEKIKHNTASYLVNNLPLCYFGMTDLFNNNKEKLFQEISYCIGNVIKNKNEPPVAISDELRLLQAGFDKKTSFRHPVK